MAFAPPAYLSPSSIGTFEQCPLRFKYTRIDGVREPPTEATLLGNFVHDVLENLYLAPAEERTLSFARNLARLLWDDKYKNEVLTLIHESKANDFRWRAWFCIENLWKLEDPTAVSFDGVEHELNVDFDGVAVKGFIDRYTVTTEGTLAISDYKTGKVPSKAFEDDKFTQLFIYALGLEQQQIGKVSDVQLIYLKGPKTLHRPVTPDDLLTTRKLIETTKKEIDIRCEQEYFEPKKSQLCNWCYFKSKCPAWKAK